MFALRLLDPEVSHFRPSGPVLFPKASSHRIAAASGNDDGTEYDGSLIQVIALDTAKRINGSP